MRCTQCEISLQCISFWFGSINHKLTFFIVGILKKWQLVLYGTDVNPIRLKSRSISQPNYAGTSTFNRPRQFHPQSRQQSNNFPRYESQDYLFPGASEIVGEVEKPQLIRSQCRNEYWIPDLFVCVNDCPEGYFAGNFCGNVKIFLSCVCFSSCESRESEL